MITDERGVSLVIFALMLLVLLGFMALGIEAGRWYLVRAELSKGVDAAALAAAKNISNPFVNPRPWQRSSARRISRPATSVRPAPGRGTVRFNATLVEPNKVSVTGNVDATPVLAQLFGVTTIPVSAERCAQKKEVEIMMILDRSGSMDGGENDCPEERRRPASSQFFQATAEQGQDRA